MQGKTLPSATMAESALKFAVGKPKLLISCRAGQGRSAAMACLVISIEQGSEQAINLNHGFQRPSPAKQSKQEYPAECCQISHSSDLYYDYGPRVSHVPLWEQWSIPAMGIHRQLHIEATRHTREENRSAQ
jgi:hypothetical protein